MSTAAQQVIYVPVTHDGYPDSHEPLHDTRDCHGCDEFRFRRSRNHRAGKSIGVAVRGGEPHEPVGHCTACKAPCYAAMADHTAAWAWNHDVDRAQWGVEPRNGKTHPRTLCPRCRPAAK